jgi:hypothetical protein
MRRGRFLRLIFPGELGTPLFPRATPNLLGILRRVLGTHPGPRFQSFAPRRARRVVFGICRSEISCWKRRRRIAAHLGIPIRPRTRIDDSRWCMIQRVPEIIIGHIPSNRTHILGKSIRHRVSHETHRIRKCLLRLFEPNDVGGEFQSLRIDGNGFHRSYSGPARSAADSIPGKRSRSTSRAAVASRFLTGSGSPRRLPSSK